MKRFTSFRATVLVLIAALCLSFVCCNNQSVGGNDNANDRSVNNIENVDGQSVGSNENAETDLGGSDRFSQQELEAAAECVRNKLSEFDGCTLTKLWYDEVESDSVIEIYLNNGNGSENGATYENTIVLFSDFTTNESAADGFEPNSSYSGWSWTLIRDDKSGKWRADDWGY